MSDMLGTVAFMVGHDDDVVLDPRVAPVGSRGRGAARSSRWAGLQSDLAIVAGVREAFPRLEVSTVRTVEELRATEAEVVVVVSYKTQTSYAWYAAFFAALRELEARGKAVYPSASFKELVSSKAAYAELLTAAGLPLCPTKTLDISECTGTSGAVVPAQVEARLGASLRSLGLLPPPAAGADGEPPRALKFNLVSKPSNSDGGFGVAFWESDGVENAPGAAPPPAASENSDVQRAGADGAAVAAGTEGEAAACASAPTPLLDSLRMCTMLTAGHGRLPDPIPIDGGAGPAADAPAPEFLRYLSEVGFAGGRPHVLLQPLVPQLGQNFEVKIYFLRRTLLCAALSYGKEKLMARVVRPDTDADVFRYLEPLVAASLRALDCLPADGPHDPKILMRVDWGAGEPQLPTAAADDEAADGDQMEPAERNGRDLKRALVQRATSLAAPQRRLKQCMRREGGAALGGEGGHFINEVEIHPGYYVDWDETRDRTIEPLANAYGEYVTQLLTERRSASA